ncbi:MAG: sodium:solute symporter family protein [Cyclobacteriaceae bacterium]|nr:MAG: sodium:solute symporter family protein [Cyclobacteriaceae bacterium]
MIYSIVSIGYLILLIGVIIYKSKSVKNEEDFTVAGRGVPVYLLVGTLICTWIGSGSLFGTAGLSFRSGFGELWFSAGAWIGIIVIYFVAERVRKIAKITLTDLLEQRYNHTARILGSVTIIVAYLVIAGYQFKGGGRFISILSNGAIDLETGALITCVVVIAFTALAGMVSIVSIDIFNGIVMLVAMILTLPFAIAAHGGVDAVVTTIEGTKPEYLSLFEGHDGWWILGVILPTFLLLMSESSIYQKFASAKDSASAKKAVIGMLAGVVIIEFVMCAIAVVGFAIYSNDPRFFLEDGSINRAMSEEIILRIGFEQVPALVGSMLFAAGVAIILSTGNTFLMVTSTNLTNDILKPYFLKNADSKKIIRIQQLSIAILGLLAYALVTQFQTVLEMAFISYTMIGASLAPVLLASFFWKRVTPTGGVASIIAGMSVPVINKLLEVAGLSIGIFPVDTDYVAIPSLAASLVMLVGVSLLTKPSPPEKWKPFFD